MYNCYHFTCNSMGMRIITLDLTTLDFSKPVSHYASLCGVSYQTMKRWFIKKGVYHQFHFTSGENTAVIRGRQIRAAYDADPKKCVKCGTPLSYEQRRGKACSSKCAAQNSYSEERKQKQGKEIKRRIAEGTWKRPTPPQIPVGTFIKPRTARKCLHCEKEMSLSPSGLHRKYCSVECASHNPALGGYREGAGAPLSGWYKGVYCNSSWELAWVIYQLDHGIQFSRNTEGFPYTFNGKARLYYPDFKMGDGSYSEMKGRGSDQWEAKKAQFPHKLHVLFAKEMKPIFAYVIGRYGSDYIRLYDGNPHNQRANECEICGKPAKRKFCSQVCSGKAVAKLRGWDKTLRPSGEPSISEPPHGSVSGGAPD